MQIWRLLFQRLQTAKTARFVRGFLVFLSHYVVKRGPAALQASTDTVQPGIFLVILQQACARLSNCTLPDFGVEQLQWRLLCCTHAES